VLHPSVEDRESISGTLEDLADLPHVLLAANLERDIVLSALIVPMPEGMLDDLIVEIATLVELGIQILVYRDPCTIGTMSGHREAEDGSIEANGRHGISP